MDTAFLPYLDSITYRMTDFSPDYTVYHNPPAITSPLTPDHNTTHPNDTQSSPNDTQKSSPALFQEKQIQPETYKSSP
jgi:hypothetical protein